MAPTARIATPRKAWQPGDIERTTRTPRGVGEGVFWLYMFFLVDFFLHLSARIPGYGAIRPTLLLVLLITWSLFSQRIKIQGRANDPIFKAILLLIAYIIVTVPIVEYPGSVVKNNLPDFVKAVVFLFFTGFIVDSSRRLKVFIFVFIGCQLIRVFEPLYLNVTMGYWGSKTFVGEGNFAYRLSGAPSDIINPNELGFVIVTSIPFLHFLLFSGGWKQKIFYCFLMSLLIYALILTMSRGAFVALIMIALMIFKESSHKTLILLTSIVIVIISWGAMTPIQKDRYLSLISDDASGASTVQGRLDGIVNEFSLGLSRPLVGHGLGTTPEAKTHKLGKYQASHNMYGELLIEVGVLGAFIFFLFILRIYQRSLKNRKVLEAIKGKEALFLQRINKCIVSLIFMYAVYSINYYGLSQYYWYLLGGLTIASGRIVEFLSETNTSKPKTSPRPKLYFGVCRKINQ